MESIQKNNLLFSNRLLNTWFENISLPVASRFSKIGVNSMHLISSSNRNNYIHLADLLKIENLRNRISSIINDVEIKVYN